jgi:integrase
MHPQESTMRKHLTDEAVKAAKLSSGRSKLEIYDSECPGLVLRVYPALKSYCWYGRHDGRFQKITIGPAGALGMKLAAARKVAREMRERALAGVDPRSAAGEDAPETLAQLADLWMKQYAVTVRDTHADDAMLLRVHVLPALGTRRLVTVDGPTVARLHATIQEKQRKRDAEQAVRLERAPRANAGARIADRVVGVIKSIFRWGVPLGYVAGDPTIGIRKAAGKRGSGRSGRDRVLDDAELRMFLAALPTIYPDEQRQIISRLLILLGSRKSEVSDMEIAELHLDGPEPYWMQPAARVKNAHDHVVPLPPAAVALLKRAIAMAGGSHYVFPSPGTGKPAASLSLHITLAKQFKAGTIKVRTAAG